MSFRQKNFRKISPGDAFDQIAKALEPELAARRFVLVEQENYPEAFGSRYATFTSAVKHVCLTWDGREQWFVLEGVVSADEPPPLSQPVWIDLTLQRFEPVKGDEKWVGELIEDITAAFKSFAKPDS